MEKKPIDTSALGKSGDDDDLNKYGAGIRRKLQKIQNGSFAQKLNEKFKQKRLQELKKKEGNE